MTTRDFIMASQFVWQSQLAWCRTRIKAPRGVYRTSVTEVVDLQSDLTLPQPWVKCNKKGFMRGRNHELQFALNVR